MDGQGEGDGDGDGDGQSAEITPAVRSTAAEEKEVEKEEESSSEKQEVLETRLQEAESFAEQSKQAARELEAVVAGLREEQVRGSGAPVYSG